jgi:hypothetical protein
MNVDHRLHQQQSVRFFLVSDVHVILVFWVSCACAGVPFIFTFASLVPSKKTAVAEAPCAVWNANNSAGGSVVKVSHDRTIKSFYLNRTLRQGTVILSLNRRSASAEPRSSSTLVGADTDRVMPRDSDTDSKYVVICDCDSV